MSALIVAALKVAFLVLMWLFILFAVQVIRTDLWGRQVATTSTELGLAEPARGKRRRRGSRNAPTVLAVVEGAQQGLRIPMLGVVGIGRSEDSALLIEDDYASTRHAQLTMDDDGHWWLEDLRSTNGTYLNDLPVTAPVRVNTGDRIRIGRTTMMPVKS